MRLTSAVFRPGQILGDDKRPAVAPAQPDPPPQHPVRAGLWPCQGLNSSTPLLPDSLPQGSGMRNPHLSATKLMQNIMLLCWFKFSAYFYRLKSWRLVVQDSVRDPWRFYTDPDPTVRTTGLRSESYIFFNDFQNANKNMFSPCFL